MFSQLFNRSTAIFRNAFGYRPTARFFATRSPFPCITCQFRIVSTEGFTPALCAGCVPDPNALFREFCRALAGQERRIFRLPSV
jgi:hypothetical protein